MTNEFESRIRSISYGEKDAPSLIDRYGVWLSARMIRRFTSTFEGKRVGDFGCGFQAKFARSILDSVHSITLADVSLAPDLTAHPKVIPVLGTLPDSLRGLPQGSLDIILCISVLEHLWNPLDALTNFQKLLAPNGVCVLNVPSWRGKRFLEYSAFRLGLSPPEEMNDHKNYYDVKDLWPLLVRAGFRPSDIRCFSHKFGLNTFAVCRVRSE